MRCGRSHGWLLAGLVAVWLTVAASADGVERMIRYGFTVENTTGRMVEEAHLWAYAPLEHTAYQVCRDLEVSHPYVVETDAWGNRILHFTFKDLPPYRHLLVRVEARMDMQAEPGPVETELPAAAGPLYELDDEAFARHVPAFGGEEPQDLARQAYQWTSAHIHYGGYDREDRGADHALLQRSGDCTEYMALMVALCRRYGIPVRGMAGYVYDRSAVVRPGDLHNWAEAQFDGRWWVIDPLMKKFKADGDDYVAMYAVGNVTNAMQGFARFRYEGDGLKVTMTKR